MSAAWVRDHLQGMLAMVLVLALGWSGAAPTGLVQAAHAGAPVQETVPAPLQPAPQDRAAVPAPVLLTRAQVLVSDARTLPPADAGWRSVSLPHRERKPADADLVGFWYKATFTATSVQPPLWLYLPHLLSGGTVFVNGQEVADIQGADAATQVRWYRPHLLLLPPMALRPGENLLAVRLAIREPFTSFGEMEIGAEGPLRARFDRLYFWENTVAEISAAICMLAGVLILGFWMRRPQEKLYGLFGTCVLFWGLRTLLLRLPVVPMGLIHAWRLSYYFTTAGFIVLIASFMLSFSASARPRLIKGLVAYWVLGCLLFAIGGMPLRPLMSSWWLPGFLPMTLYAVWKLCHFAWRIRTGASLAMGLAVGFALALSLHDYAVQEAWFGLSEIYLMHLAIPSFLLVMAAVLSNRFLDSLEKVESSNERLALRVAEREREIVASYSRLRTLERVHAATEERQRIMQDMHDGVGSQLMTTLVMVERGTADRDLTVILLQECLDDMRLTIDSLSPDESDLLPLLGNFRFRMASRLKAMGLTLHWVSHAMPDALEVAPHSGLHILRMLQEALANVLKHAHAANVTVCLHFSPQTLRIDVSDDGVGFAPALVAGGCGLGNMRSRARKIGATFAVVDGAPGTTIHFVIPLETTGQAAEHGRHSVEADA